MYHIPLELKTNCAAPSQTTYYIYIIHIIYIFYILCIYFTYYVYIYILYVLCVYIFYVLYIFLTYYIYILSTTRVYESPSFPDRRWTGTQPLQTLRSPSEGLRHRRWRCYLMMGFHHGKPIGKPWWNPIGNPTKSHYPMIFLENF